MSEDGQKSNRGALVYGAFATIVAALIAGVVLAFQTMVGSRGVLGYLELKLERAKDIAFLLEQDIMSHGHRPGDFDGCRDALTLEAKLSESYEDLCLAQDEVARLEPDRVRPIELALERLRIVAAPLLKPRAQNPMAARSKLTDEGWPGSVAIVPARTASREDEFAELTPGTTWRGRTPSSPDGAGAGTEGEGDPPPEPSGSGSGIGPSSWNPRSPASRNVLVHG